MRVSKYVPLALLVALIVPALLWLRLQSLPLAQIARGGQGPPTIVLLHGYGSRAEDWSQFDKTWRFPSDAHLVFLQAPLRHPVSGRRGWWWLHLETYVPPGETLPDMSTANPGGIKVASRLVRDAIKDEQQPLFLGGFSQGAMTSAEVAFQTDQELAGLILLSGTTVNEQAWAEHFAGRRHLPIFIAHGTNDGVLPFAIMDNFQQRLKAFGMNVTWLPFEGGHEIPDIVIREMGAFVGRVIADRRTQP